MNLLDAFNNILAYDDVSGYNDDLDSNQAYVDSKRNYDSTHGFNRLFKNAPQNLQTFENESQSGLEGLFSGDYGQRYTMVPSRDDEINLALQYQDLPEQLYQSEYDALPKTVRQKSQYGLEQDAKVADKNAGIISGYERPDEPDLAPEYYEEQQRQQQKRESERERNATDYELAASINGGYVDEDIANNLRTTSAGDSSVLEDLLDRSVIRGTPEWAKSVYDRGFDAIESRPSRMVDRFLGADAYIPQSVRAAKDNEFVDIDMGRGVEDREKPYMTGQQYLEYRNMGLPGRPVYDIAPDAIYNKYDEQVNYGFIPYLVTEEGGAKFAEDAMANSVNNAVNNLANARKDSFDYTIDFGGRKLSGHDFEDSYTTWSSRNPEENAEIHYDEPYSEASVPMTYTLTDEDGNVMYLPDNANIKRKEDGSPDIEYGLVDDGNGVPVRKYYLDLGVDGQVWSFDDIDDFNASFGSAPAEQGGASHPVTFYAEMEPLVLEDGTVIRADKARELGQNYKDLSDYGTLDMANPTPDMLSLPGLVDLVLGSAPIFSLYTGIPMGVANAQANLNGMQPGAQNRNGEYSMLSENPTAAQVYGSAAGSLALPLTEQLWGPIGGKLAKTFPGAKALARRAGNAGVNFYEHPLGQLALGTIGEGLEEIPGNFAEELRTYGFTPDYFAPPMYYDENWNLTEDSTWADGSPAPKAYDAQGRQIRKTDVGLGSRLIGSENSFLGQAPESMLGGSFMGAVLGAPASLLPLRKWQRAADRRAERDALGYNIDRF